MAESFALPVVPSAPELSRPTETPRFGRQRGGAVRPSFHRAVLEDLRGAYSADDRPWVVAFSGGKDSTGLMEFVYYMLARLRAAERLKPVYVLASDTRVEAPWVSRPIRKELALLSAAADSGLGARRCRKRALWTS